MTIIKLILNEDVTINIQSVVATTVAGDTATEAVATGTTEETSQSGVTTSEGY